MLLSFNIWIWKFVCSNFIKGNLLSQTKPYFYNCNSSFAKLYFSQFHKKRTLSGKFTQSSEEFLFNSKLKFMNLIFDRGNFEIQNKLVYLFLIIKNWQGGGFSRFQKISLASANIPVIFLHKKISVLIFQFTFPYIHVSF